MKYHHTLKTTAIPRATTKKYSLVQCPVLCELTSPPLHHHTMSSKCTWSTLEGVHTLIKSTPPSMWELLTLYSAPHQPLPICPLSLSLSVLNLFPLTTSSVLWHGLTNYSRFVSHPFANRLCCLNKLFVFLFILSRQVLKFSISQLTSGKFSSVITPPSLYIPMVRVVVLLFYHIFKWIV